jgi:hypothetical protein
MKKSKEKPLPVKSSHYYLWELGTSLLTEVRQIK